MARLGAYALISSLNNLVSKLYNTSFTTSSSSSVQAPDAHAFEVGLRRLKGILERIKATLYDAEERNIQDKSVKLWLKEIRELGHEAEYVLEEYMYEVYRAQVMARDAIKGDFDAGGVCSIQIPDGMVVCIRDIKSRFEEIANDREALFLREEDAPRRKKIKYIPKPTSPIVVEKSIFGRNDEKEKVINSLLLKEEVISVMSIVGKGGIGKTTVAQLVYNDKRVQDSFDLVGWVYVSNNFCLERITRHIIESFTKTGCTLTSPSVLLEELANKVQEKRVFLVLDDVWNEDTSLWESLCIPLMRAVKLTILVTTRNITVARIMQTMNPLQLAYLSDDESWLLFTHYAFHGIHSVNQVEFVEIGKKIVKQCSGLPLAVKSIASLLSHEEEFQSWVDILQSDLWKLDAENEMLAPLQISYEHLPTYLKSCFLLCSMFPKDHEYSMNLMSRLWIANGYIEPKERKSIEEVASNYTKMLYERSFFDDYKIKYDKYGLPIDATFRLHDMMHDLAWLNSEKTCCSIERGKQPFILETIRHLYMKEEPRGLLQLLPFVNIPLIETFVVRFLWDDVEISLSSLSKAKCLRALHLEYPKEVLPFTLGNLKHLRYLFLGAEFVAQIAPQSIFLCYNLRILILDLSWHYINLDCIGKLINLEFLQLFVSSLNLPESLGLLKKLRILEIYKEKYGMRKFLLPECIGNLMELQRIVISGFDFHKLPKLLCKLKNLKELILQDCILKELPEDFGNLTSLQFLFLEELRYFPLSCRKLLPSCAMNVCNLTTQPDSHHGAIGWLKKFNDLKGALMINDIQNITSIKDAKNTNLIRKHNLETLSLIWNKKDYLNCIRHGISFSHERSFWEAFLLEGELPLESLTKRGMLGIEIGYFRNCKSIKGQDFDILEIFQPHPNLKNLDICSYHGLEFPKWMGDPLSCASLVKLWIRSCYHISSLPFGKVLSLKHLYIAYCGKLLHLKRKSLPSQLKHLTIRECNSLVEVALLESLTQLEISTCNMLESIATSHLKMPETTSEFASDYYRLEPSKELKGFTSLKKLTIRRCPNLAANLLLAEDCEVNTDCWYEAKCYSEYSPDSSLRAGCLFGNCRGIEKRTCDVIKITSASNNHYDMRALPIQVWTSQTQRWGMCGGPPSDTEGQMLSHSELRLQVTQGEQLAERMNQMGTVQYAAAATGDSVRINWSVKWSGDLISLHLCNLILFS